MRYWPLSYLLPMVPQGAVTELKWATDPRVTEGELSQATVNAVAAASQRMPPILIPAVQVPQIDAPGRLLFLRYPSWEEWRAVERACVMSSPDGDRALFLNPLH
jgi:hypothetical protein